jgi:DNA-binding response OmpR family regulator
MSKSTYNILIVEDEWVNAIFMQELLVSFGHTVLAIVASSDKTINAIKQYPIDFIFMDINIQGKLDGIQLAHLINDIQEIPIIYMTAFGDSNTIEEASKSNIYGFVIKPFNESDIEATLNVAIARLKRENNKILKEQIHNRDELILSNNYKYHFKKETLYFNDNIIKFSKNETKLMYLFCLNCGEIVSTDSLYNSVWNAKEVTDSTLRDTISRIRKKVPGLQIENIMGVGYSLKKRTC